MEVLKESHTGRLDLLLDLELQQRLVPLPVLSLELSLQGLNLELVLQKVQLETKHRQEHQHLLMQQL